MQTHLENIPVPDRKGLRNFAFTIGGVVIFLFGLFLPWLFDGNFPTWPWIFGFVFICWGVVLPGSLRSIYQYWMLFGLLLHKITTPIILAIIYYMVIFPVGLLKSIFGKDAMHIKYDKSKHTYRTKSVKREKESLERMF